jgi:hypothetical protein
LFAEVQNGTGNLEWKNMMKTRRSIEFLMRKLDAAMVEIGAKN